MWQDWVISVAQLVFVVALIPSLLHHEHKPALWTSVPTAFGLFLIVCAYISLSLWWSAATSSLLFVGWITLAIQIFLRKKQ